jgi:hypothetical protein
MSRLVAARVASVYCTENCDVSWRLCREFLPAPKDVTLGTQLQTKPLPSTDKSARGSAVTAFWPVTRCSLVSISFMLYISLFS